MHRAAVAAFATIASVVVASLAAPAVAHGSDDPGVTFVDHVATADVVVVGQAHDVRPGRVLNGCQLTAATVRIEEVLLGDLPSPAPGDLTVEFAGDCRQVGALGGAVPTERAIWFLVNKGAWLREMVVPRSGDWSEEDPYWRPLEPDAIPVERGGALAKHGSGTSWLPSITFEQFAGDVRESAYLRTSEGRRASIGLGIWFSAQAYLAAAALVVAAGLIALGALMLRGRARRLGLLVAGVAFAGACVAFVGGPRLARTIDFMAGSADRTTVLDALRAGTLAHVEYDDYALPAGLDHLSRDGRVQAIAGPPTMAFFFTQAFFSPDPYCGYEYAQIPDVLVLDPHGSGGGRAEELGDGWYWVCAS